MTSFVSSGAKKKEENPKEVYVLRLTHLHVLWIDANKRTQYVVFLIRQQGFVQLLLLL